MPEQFPQKILGDGFLSFSVSEFGLYALFVTIRCLSGNQTGFRGGQDVYVEVDESRFGELPPNDTSKYKDTPPSWNGTQLKGHSKTVVFILPLNQGEHRLYYHAQPESMIDRLEARLIQDRQNILFEINQKAEDGDRRPWYTFVLIELPLKTMTADISTQWHWWDGDDVKLIIDGIIQKNNKSLRHKDWLWSSSAIKKIFGKEKESKAVINNLGLGLHYIEFWADRTPTLHQLEIDIGKDISFKRIPSFGDPEWTEDLSDDSEVILLARLILGEAEGQPMNVKLGVGFSVLNRVAKQRSNWGLTIKEIILKPNQYDGIWNEMRFDRVRNPLHKANTSQAVAWLESYEAARAIIFKTASDPTRGATNFHSYTKRELYPDWATDDRFRTKIGDVFFYELDR